VLKNGESLESDQLLWEVGFSRNTLRLHIAGLKRQGMIVQALKTKKNGPGGFEPMPYWRYHP